MSLYVNHPRCLKLKLPQISRVDATGAANHHTARRIEALAVHYFCAVLYASAETCAPFRGLITVPVGEEQKPLLLVGTAHLNKQDGHCIAVLNPDPDLVDQLHGGCGYTTPILKEIVSKRCDLALDIWIDAYREDGITVTTRYIAQEAKPAKFAVN